jgi:hypothetical protein
MNPGWHKFEDGWYIRDGVGAVFITHKGEWMVSLCKNGDRRADDIGPFKTMKRGMDYVDAHGVKETAE